MDGQSRARGSHDLLLLGTRKLPEYRLCYGGGGLDRKGVHEHARRRRHFFCLFQPAIYRWNLMSLYARMSAYSHQERGIWIQRKLRRSGIFADSRIRDPSSLARILVLIGLNRATLSIDDAQSHRSFEKDYSP